MGCMQMLLIYLVTIYLALYLVIWQHEVGHALVMHYYKCKERPFKVHVPFYIFFSTPMPYDINKVQTLERRQRHHIGMAGIAVNIIFGVPTAGLLLLADIGPSLFSFFLFAFAIFHLTEAASYLLINNIFLSGDITQVQQYKPWLRIPYFGIGLLAFAAIVFLLLECPSVWQSLFVTASVVMIICTAIGRLLFRHIIQPRLLKEKSLP